MKARIRFFLALSALLAVALAACQVSQEPGQVSVNTPSAAEDTDLRLVVKDSAACQELRDSLRAGSADSVARATFVAECVVEVAPHRPLPPRPVDPALRCAWAAAQIDSGRLGLVRAYAKHCAAACDSLAALPDSMDYAKYCLAPPRPVPPARDSVKGPRPDSPDSLKPAHPPRDSAKGPRPEACARHAVRLATLTPGTAAYERLRAELEAHCPVPQDTVTTE